MRTTLTLDDDVNTRIRAEASKSGKSMKEVVNEYLRRGLHTQREWQTAVPFSLRVKKLKLREELSTESIGSLLERVEASSHS